MDVIPTLLKKVMTLFLIECWIVVNLGVFLMLKESRLKHGYIGLMVETRDYGPVLSNYRNSEH